MNPIEILAVAVSDLLENARKLFEKHDLAPQSITDQETQIISKLTAEVDEVNTKIKGILVPNPNMVNEPVVNLSSVEPPTP